jgi:dTDP-4-dehydrorhamnose 3,5-epimerase-like enzyme
MLQPNIVSPPTNGRQSRFDTTPQSPALRASPLRQPLSLDDCRIIDLPKINDPRGNLTFIEGGRHVPFEIKRVYYLYDVPGGAERGGHAHKGLHEFIVAMSGSFDVVLNDGTQQKRFHLNRSYNGMYVCPMVWRELDNFSSGSVCMVLASNFYDEADYYRDYAEFVRALNL